MMYPAWTTNDLATTRPLKGVVSYMTGRAGAMAYLKNTSAPPELIDTPERGFGSLARIDDCQQSVTVLYTLDVRNRLGVDPPNYPLEWVGV